MKRVSFRILLFMATNKLFDLETASIVANTTKNRDNQTLFAI